MTYDLYFHNDFDGRASAAVMLSFLESRGHCIGHFVPVDFDLQTQWLDDSFFKKHHLFKGKRNAPVVLDFPFHPGTAFWFDHHPTTFKKKSWRKHFREDARHVCRPRYPSCCHMVYATLKRNFGWRPPTHFRELIAWLDVIDGARYASPEQTIRMKEPAFAVDSFIESQGKNVKTAEWVIRNLAVLSLADVAKIPRVAAAGDRSRRAAARNLAFYRKYIVVRGNVTYIDLSRHGDALLRYAPYYLFPKVRYNFRAAMKGKLYHFGVGENPWLESKSKIHLGKLFAKYGGGGHETAAGVDFRTKEEADRAREEIIEKLNSIK